MKQVSDANIFIDMQAGGLLAEMFRLSFQIAVPDIVYLEELQGDHPELPGLGLQVLAMASETIAAVEVFGRRYPKPGRYDLLAMALARQENCGLLTGDRDLRAAAEAEDMEAHGTLWLMEQIREELKIGVDALALAYQRMRQADRRLPWDQVEDQLGRWRRTG